jgi:hypothetical protein
MHDTLKKGFQEGVAVPALGKGLASKTQCLVRRLDCCRSYLIIFQLELWETMLGWL